VVHVFCTVAKLHHPFRSISACSAGIAALDRRLWKLHSSLFLAATHAPRIDPCLRAASSADAALTQAAGGECGADGLAHALLPRLQSASDRADVITDSVNSGAWTTEGNAKRTDFLADSLPLAACALD
jgi:hypothetical protein